MANTAIPKEGLTIDQLRDRLNGAAPPEKKERPSVASAVRALLPEVRMKRAAGWTWEQIAAAMYDDEAKASAIRTAYNRLVRSKGKGKGKNKGGKPPEDPNLDSDASGSLVAKVEDYPISGRDTHQHRPDASAQWTGGEQASPRPAPPVFVQLNDPGFRPNRSA